MDYWELRKLISKIIPAQITLLTKTKEIEIKEKGRKSNYRQFNLQAKGWEKKERLLNTREISNFIEVSVRAAACPMPLNIDLWDGLHCPHRCVYCYADYFRSSLYSSFFDNCKNIGLRYCNVDYCKRELDKLLFNKVAAGSEGEIKRAIDLKIPIRLGIRFDNFHPLERKTEISLSILRHLAISQYPVMVNTKSDIIGEEKYVRAMADNKSAVHMTIITSNEKMLKNLEPGAPSFKRRLWAIKQLTDAGVRVVARIEPFMVFINDEREDVEEYMEKIWEVGVRHLTFDTFSYSTKSKATKNAIDRLGYNFDRMFLVTSDSQPLGSLLLEKFMEVFTRRGFSASTFDLGSVRKNSQIICCEVGDLFSGFNYGNIVVALKYIYQRRNKPTCWKDFTQYVNNRGGFLSSKLEIEVKKLWNMEGKTAYSLGWGDGLSIYGLDEDGIIWKPSEENYRERILRGIL